jgi:hypothetical protein
MNKVLEVITRRDAEKCVQNYYEEHSSGRHWIHVSLRSRLLISKLPVFLQRIERSTTHVITSKAPAVSQKEVSWFWLSITVERIVRPISNKLPPDSREFLWFVRTLLSRPSASTPICSLPRRPWSNFSSFTRQNHRHDVANCPNGFRSWPMPSRK